MALNCGMVGLPNVGKSTLFQALTSVPVEVANYPFCTIEPNRGIVMVLDQRIDRISKLFKPDKIIRSSLEFLDIAGLVKGASKGEGLGSQFLAHIRQVHAVIHVVRCFEDSDIIHVDDRIDPVEDIMTIDLELILADLEVVIKKLATLMRFSKGRKTGLPLTEEIDKDLLRRVKLTLEDGRSVRSLKLSSEERKSLEQLDLITLKDVIYVCNVDENSLEGHPLVERVRGYVEKGAEVLTICAKAEAEIMALETMEEREEFMELSGIKVSGLERLTSLAYKILKLETYFTAGKKEVRAWSFSMGSTAPQAAGLIHTDFERGFIKAEVYHCDDLFKWGSEQKMKERGVLRIEGKEYIVRDGDIVHFRFNV